MSTSESSSPVIRNRKEPGVLITDHPHYQSLSNEMKSIPVKSHRSTWRTLGELLCERAQAHPERPFTRFDLRSSDVDLTYGEAWTLACRWAALFKSFGFSTGRTILRLYQTELISSAPFLELLWPYLCLHRRFPAAQWICRSSHPSLLIG